MSRKLFPAKKCLQNTPKKVTFHDWLKRLLKICFSKWMTTSMGRKLKQYFDKSEDIGFAAVVTELLVRPSLVFYAVSGIWFFFSFFSCTVFAKSRHHFFPYICCFQGQSRAWSTRIPTISIVNSITDSFTQNEAGERCCWQTTLILVINYCL